SADRSKIRSRILDFSASRRIGSARAYSSPMQVFRRAPKAHDSQDEGDESVEEEDHARTEDHHPSVNVITRRLDAEDSHVASRSQFQQADRAELPHPDRAS